MSELSTPVLDFYDLCAAHDWQWENADDHGAWQRGRDEHYRLYALLVAEPDEDTSRALTAMWNAWISYAAGRRPKPEPPESAPTVSYPVVTIPPIKPEYADRSSDRLALIEAMDAQTLVRVSYEDRDGVRSVRYVVPNTVERNKETGELFVRVYDAQRRAPRTFTLDRITDVTTEF